MRFLLLMISVVFSLATKAQRTGEAFYVYRNDGHFNAFLLEDVDSISYSRYDVDSILHNTYCTQEVYTMDSIYRIPLTAIDSIGFVSPEVIYKPNVRRVEDLMSEYLLNVDGLKLTFSGGMPKSICPKRNEILLCLDFDNPFFEEGYAGKVSKVIDDDGNIVVECDSVGDITEIFEQLIAVENIVCESPDDSRAGLRRAMEHIDTDLYKFDVDLNHDFINTSYMSAGIKGHLGGGNHLNAVYKITSEEQFIELTLTNTFDIGIGISAEGDLPLKTFKYTKAPFPAARFPAACPILKCQLTPALFFRGKVTASLDISAKAERKTVYTMTYKDGTFHGTSTAANERPVWSCDWGANFSIDGFIQAGIQFDLYFGTVNILGLGYIGASLDMYVGPKLSGKINADLKEIPTMRAYDIFKDSKVSLTALSLDFEAKGKAKYLWQDVKEHTFYTQNMSFFNFDFYLFPEFTKPNVSIDTQNNNTVEVSTTVSRMVLFPLSLGIGLFDNNEKMLKYSYDSRSYNLFSNYNDLNISFNDLKAGQYNARPIIKFASMDLAASPSETFTIGSPVEISSVNVTKARWNRTGFEYNGKKYPFKFDCDVTVKLIESENVEDWGYMYIDPEGNCANISLLGQEHVYKDSRYSYCRNTPEATVVLCGYVKIIGEQEYRYGEQLVFPLIYDEEPSITYQSAEIIDVNGEPQYDGDGSYLFTWYTTKFKYVIKITGGYWIDNIQPMVYDNGSWSYNGGKARVPGDGLYSVTTSMNYDNTSNMNWSTGYNITLTDGSTMYSSNTLQIGGTPESPTISVGGSASSAANSRRSIKQTEKKNNVPTFGELVIEEIR